MGHNLLGYMLFTEDNEICRNERNKGISFRIETVLIATTKSTHDVSHETVSQSSMPNDLTP